MHRFLFWGAEMKKSVYAKGIAGQLWYNFTEAVACTILCKPTPKELIYTHRISYGTEKSQYVNTYCRKDLVNKKKPVLIYIHGGGWVSGISEMRNIYIAQWAKLGFFTASIHYSYAPQKTFPSQFREVFSAIDYIFDRKDEWNIDTDNIVISGESAGGHFILYIAQMLENKELFDKLGIEFRHRDEFSVKAVIPHCTCHNFEKLLDKCSPQSKYPGVKMMVSTYFGMDYKEASEWVLSPDGQLSFPRITKDFPPVFVTWASKDLLRYESLDLMQSLEECGVPYGSFRGTGVLCNHGWTIVTLFKQGRECLSKTFDFVLPYISDYFECENGKWNYKEKTDNMNV